jgi:hypothetical protein
LGTLSKVAFVAIPVTTSFATFAQVPINGTQSIKESMSQLVNEGYRLVSVDGQSLASGGAVSIFYLTSKQDVARCSEAFGLPGRPATIFPCERLTAPHENK